MYFSKKNKKMTLIKVLVMISTLKIKVLIEVHQIIQNQCSII